ncbi:MAG: WYL domain-containing protein, partial [Bacteroidaceae bacterium]|nr:WYL domain-containing protein [Bacteroidaceae bacterium]
DIKKKQVLSVVYMPVDRNEMTLIIHPHYLKEYNGRWHLFGYADKEQSKLVFDVALDRIVTFADNNDIDYVPAPKGYYESFFANIVGVSHWHGSVKKNICVRARSNYMFNLMITKPIHPNQATIKPFGEYSDGTYGEFVLPVEMNNELIGSILQMGPELEVISPPEVREVFKSRLKEMFSLYNETTILPSESK